MLSNSSRYSPMVRLGNWYEDICLEQDKIEQFKKKRDSGELLVDKTRILFDNFYDPVQSRISKDFLYFGNVVQLVPLNMKMCEVDSKIVYPALSIVVNDKVLRQGQNICDDCEMTLANTNETVRRNCFRIVSIDGKNCDGDVIRYKQKFALETVANTTKQLLFYSAPKCFNLSSPINTTYDSQKLGEVNQNCGLISFNDVGPGKSIPLGYCFWQCEHIDAGFRFESEDYNVKVNKPLIIKHFATNKNLAAENIVISTLFGPEFLVSVTDYRDRLGRETWKNQWIIGDGRYLLDEAAKLEAAKEASQGNEAEAKAKDPQPQSTH